MRTHVSTFASWLRTAASKQRRFRDGRFASPFSKSTEKAIFERRKEAHSTKPACSARSRGVAPITGVSHRATSNKTPHAVASPRSAAQASASRSPHRRWTHIGSTPAKAQTASLFPDDAAA